LGQTPRGDHPCRLLGVSPCGDEDRRAVLHLRLIPAKRDPGRVEQRLSQLHPAESEALVRFDQPVIAGVRGFVPSRHFFTVAPAPRCCAAFSRPPGGHGATNGLPRFSWPTVVSGPWPGSSTVSSGSDSISRAEASSWS